MDQDLSLKTKSVQSFASAEDGGLLVSLQLSVVCDDVCMYCT